MGEAHAKSSIAIQSLATLICAETEQSSFLGSHRCMHLKYMAEATESIDEAVEGGPNLSLQYPENRRLFSRVCKAWCGGHIKPRWSAM